MLILKIGYEINSSNLSLLYFHTVIYILEYLYANSQLMNIWERGNFPSINKIYNRPLFIPPPLSVIPVEMLLIFDELALKVCSLLELKGTCVCFRKTNDDARDSVLDRNSFVRLVSHVDR